MLRWFAILSVIWTCLLAGCVGYVKFGRSATLPRVEAPAHPECPVFILPAQDGPGGIPAITESMDTDTVIELLGLEIMRLREVIATNKERLGNEHRQYMSSCGQSVFLHTSD